MQAYKIGPSIGAGQFGKVHIALHRRSLKRVAVKIIPAEVSDIEALKAEISTHQTLFHPNIVCMTDCFENEGEICVVTEYCSGGDLLAKLQERGKFDLDSVRNVARGLVKGLQYLHAMGIVHRDLKLQNILLDDAGNVKICDFGFSRAVHQDVTLTSVKGTPIYMAPELIREQPYTYAIDLWALGVMLYELYVGKPPFYTTNIFKLVNMITEDDVKWPPEMPSDLKALLDGLLQKVPEDRLDWPQLFKHAFLQLPESEKGAASRKVDSAIDVSMDPSTTSPKLAQSKKYAESGYRDAGSTYSSQTTTLEQEPIQAYTFPNGKVNWEALGQLSPNSDHLSIAIAQEDVLSLVARSMSSLQYANAQDGRELELAFVVVDNFLTHFEGILCSEKRAELVPHGASFMRTLCLWLSNLLKALTANTQKYQNLAVRTLELYLSALKVISLAHDAAVISIPSRPSTPVQNTSQADAFTSYVSWSLLRVVAQTFIPQLPRLLTNIPPIAAGSTCVMRGVMEVIDKFPVDLNCDFYDDILNLDLIPVLVRGLSADNRAHLDETIALCALLLSTDRMNARGLDTSSQAWRRVVSVARPFHRVLREEISACSVQQMQYVLSRVQEHSFSAAACLLHHHLCWKPDHVSPILGTHLAIKQLQDALLSPKETPTQLGNMVWVIRLVGHLITGDESARERLLLPCSKLLQWLGTDAQAEQVTVLGPVMLSIIARWPEQEYLEIIPSILQLYNRLSESLESCALPEEYQELIPLFEGPGALLQALVQIDSVADQLFSSLIDHTRSMLRLVQQSHACVPLSEFCALLRSVYSLTCLEAQNPAEALGMRKLLHQADATVRAFCSHLAMPYLHSCVVGTIAEEQALWGEAISLIVGLQVTRMSIADQEDGHPDADVLVDSLTTVLTVGSIDLPDEIAMIPLLFLDNLTMKTGWTIPEALSEVGDLTLQRFFDRALMVSFPNDGTPAPSMTERRLLVGISLVMHLVLVTSENCEAATLSLIQRSHLAKSFPSLLIHPFASIRLACCQTLHSLIGSIDGIESLLDTVGVFNLLLGMARVEPELPLRRRVWRTILLCVQMGLSDQLFDRILQLAHEVAKSKLPADAYFRAMASQILDLSKKLASARSRHKTP
ncbi:hypothetical protein DFS34DRAFT_619776 [Phlyctochytrium arcticum]|nr:hypothetical protein DFS34DRAFT_619776 [Phlyctochytrium arcticum]